MEPSYIYFGTYYDGFLWASFKEAKEMYASNPDRYTEEQARRYLEWDATIKIGETKDLYHRAYTVDTPITMYVKFEGTKSDRLFVEAYLRSMYDANCNMEHCGNDHFRCMNVNTLKGARNRFFDYVAMAFETLHSMNGRHYEWTCELA